MSKRGLPETVRMRHDAHYVETLTASAGAPVGRMIPIEQIDPNPNQPRQVMGDLSELIASVQENGIIEPIVVRQRGSRFQIVAGERRYQAAVRAGIEELPVVIRDVDDVGILEIALVENLQRNELTAREIADYIGRELAKGVKKGEIAKAISKSPAFVTQHAALLDLPDPIAEAFNSGRVKDVTVVNELVTAFKKKPQEVTDWLEDENQEITRGSVKLLREFLDDKRKHEDDDRDPNTVDVLTGKTDAEAGDGEQGSGSDSKKEEKEPDPDKLKKAIVQVQHNERPARLILNRRPPAEGFAWLKYEDDGQEFEANLSSVTLVALLEG